MLDSLWHSPVFVSQPPELVEDAHSIARGARTRNDQTSGPVGGPANRPIVCYHGFLCRAASWDRPGAWWPRSSGTRVRCSPCRLPRDEPVPLGAAGFAGLQGGQG